MPSRILLPMLLPLLLVPLAWTSDIPPSIQNTQDPNDTPPTPIASLERFHLPEGFTATLFAAEPEVAQPIALSWDDRGRLWVAECFSYPDWTDDPSKGRDRILILEDTDGDGRFDQRTVFWDRAYNLTGLVWGNGGIYVTCPPHFAFIPDHNADDRPDGPPQVLIDGFSLKAKHNIVNGLTWGPDGWIYGRHGITWESLAGKPGTPDAERIRMNCSIWRYHPRRHTFEVVCNGTTNPYGLDFNEVGEAFFTNCVIGHLWHMLPGAHYQRMFGQDYNRYAYELIDQTGDHLHWGGGDWTSSREAVGVHDDAGGGHAHSGALIYLGDNWPESFRGKILMNNIHGRRINVDRLERLGCSYIGKHEPDMFRTDNAWHRGVAITSGPDGAVYISDWADLGECHDHDGVHRTSGRIYRFAYGKPEIPRFDLAKKSNAELVALLKHRNEWFVRHAQRLLAERAADGQAMESVQATLRDMFTHANAIPHKLRAMWALYDTGGIDREWLQRQLHHANEHVRSWAIRLLCDVGPPPNDVIEDFAGLAAEDPSGLVRVHLASMMQRLPLERRYSIARPLASHQGDATDRVQPLMIWYGIEPALLTDLRQATDLATTTQIPKLRGFIARRLAEAASTHPDGFAAMLQLASQLESAVARQRILNGLLEGLQGRRQVAAPSVWTKTRERLLADTAWQVQHGVYALDLLFDRRSTLPRVKALVRQHANTELRRALLQTLVQQRVQNLSPLLYRLLDDTDMRRLAIRALAAYADQRTPDVLLKRYPQLDDTAKQDVLNTLAARTVFALPLLDAVAAKQVPRQDITAFTARQMIALSPEVAKRVRVVWGDVRRSTEQRKAAIARYQAMLPEKVIAQADLSNGRWVYSKTCQQCHRLFDQGHSIGPDLTGSDRANLYYILENLIDPSAVIGYDYRLTQFALFDGRLVAGIIVAESDRSVTVQTATEKLLLPKEDIEERKQLPISMMPEGQIEQMSVTELRDLIAYLRSPRQVPLPENQ